MFVILVMSKIIFKKTFHYVTLLLKTLSGFLYFFKDRTISHGLKGFGTSASLRNTSPLAFLAVAMLVLLVPVPIISTKECGTHSFPLPGMLSVLVSLFLVFRACLKYSFCMKFFCVSLYICPIKVETVVQETLIPTKTAIHLLKIFLTNRRKSSPPIRDVAILPDAYQIYSATLV